MSRKEYEKSIVTIANHYGQFDQRVKLFEELGELQTAMARYILHGVQEKIHTSEDAQKLMKIAENLVEEIADVEIMLDQIKYFFDCNNEVEEVKELKILRQLERIAKCKDS